MVRVGGLGAARRPDPAYQVEVGILPMLSLVSLTESDEPGPVRIPGFLVMFNSAGAGGLDSGPRAGGAEPGTLNVRPDFVGQKWLC